MSDFEEHRGHLWGVAYRILGTVTDADDAVQEAWLRWQQADRQRVDNPRAYLTTIVSRVAYDLARPGRESYVGTWLPEPVLDDARAVRDEAGPEARAVLEESVSLAMLAVMERLSPAERTSLVLHDVFAVPYDEIASIVGRSTGAVRQLASRARRRVHEYAPRRTSDRELHLQAVKAFSAAAMNGDLPALVAVLDPDVVWHADGGGVITATRRPVVGGDKVARLVLGLLKRLRSGMRVKSGDVNGAPGGVIRDGDGVDCVLAFTVADGVITEIDVVRNPAKLRHVR